MIMLHGKDDTPPGINLQFVAFPQALGTPLSSAHDPRSIHGWSTSILEETLAKSWLAINKAYKSSIHG